MRHDKSDIIANHFWQLYRASSRVRLGTEECTTLKYKSGIDMSNNHWKSEMAKDVSAMLNANGGITVYGVKEHDEEDKRHLSEKITSL